MNKLLAIAATCALALAAIDAARASCAADSTLPEVRKAYANGQAHERAGRNEEALRSYLAAQAYICEPNPVEADAAARAAAVARPLAETAEKKGDVERAYSAYESGGHYAQADRIMLGMLRAQPDSPVAYDRANDHFRQRTETWFPVNNKARIAAAGAYRLDAKIQQEIAAWPAKACERALGREAQAFSEDFLRDTVKLYQARPQDLADFAGLESLQTEGAAFHQKWPTDRVADSHELLELALAWAGRIADATARGQLIARVRGVVGQRALTLVQKYFSAPKLLESAIAYYAELDEKSKIEDIRTRAAQLAAEAEKRNALLTAKDYYAVAGNEAKEKEVQARAEANARQKMQPTMDAMQRSAEEMRKAYSDPARVEEMKRQAEEMKRAMQKQQAQGGKSAEDLEKELGM
jgi:hypothetical protein